MAYWILEKTRNSQVPHSDILPDSLSSYSLQNSKTVLPPYLWLQLFVVNHSLKIYSWETPEINIHYFQLHTILSSMRKSPIILCIPPMT